MLFVDGHGERDAGSASSRVRRDRRRRRDLIDGEEIALEPDLAVRVGPSSKRRLRPGGDGLRMLIVGGVPGEPSDAAKHTATKLEPGDET